MKAVDDVSLTLKEGEIFGLLGPNGAGKTTLMKMVCGLIQPTRGSILIDESPIERNLARVGLMLGSTIIYYRLSGYDNLEYFAKLYGVRNIEGRIAELSNFLGLDGFLNEYVEIYSEGMKTKLALARALIHDPDILLLDEPTLGLDPKISSQMREKVIELRGRGKTILLTTHYMDEAEFLCDRVGFLNKGSLIRVDSPVNLKKSINKGNADLSEVFIKLAGENL
ncbi:MAG: ABC transporter ATP-binding protein [Methanobacteriota archaeon]